MNANPILIDVRRAFDEAEAKRKGFLLQDPVKPERIYKVQEGM